MIVHCEFCYNELADVVCNHNVACSGDGQIWQINWTGHVVGFSVWAFIDGECKYPGLSKEWLRSNLKWSCLKVQYFSIPCSMLHITMHRLSIKFVTTAKNTYYARFFWVWEYSSAMSNHVSKTWTWEREIGKCFVNKEVTTVPTADSRA